jgi:hypothetical protein
VAQSNIQNQLKKDGVFRGAEIEALLVATEFQRGMLISCACFVISFRFEPKQTKLTMILANLDMNINLIG